MWWIFLLAGCPSDDAVGDSNPTKTCDPASVCGCDPAAVEVGDGEATFTPLSAGQDVVLVHGPQGGWHVLASVEVSNTEPVVRVDYTIDVLPELSRVSNNTYNVMLANWDGCSGAYWNMFGYLDVSGIASGEADTPPELLVGRDLRLTITISDDQGRSATRELDVVGAPDPSDVEDPSGDSGSTADSAP